MKQNKRWAVSRRDFIKGALVGLAGIQAAGIKPSLGAQGTEKSKVVVVKTLDRKKGVETVMKLCRFPSMEGRKVFVKPNFNTADPSPGSTHNDTLSQIVHEIKERGVSAISVGDRCGPAKTKEVMEKKGIFDLGKDFGFDVVDFESMEESDWILRNPAGNHWGEGFYFARPLIESAYTISTCCLKTHQFGGHFTMSLKLSVGGVHRKQMGLLHGSRQKRNPFQRAMIAEINQAYTPKLVIMDGVEAFTDGGPMTGEQKTAGVFVGGTDRVAVDAVGVAILKSLGSNETIMGRKVFEQDQIQAAVELGLGVSEPDQIELVTPKSDAESRDYAEKLKTFLV